jgi:hypothetical protein
VTAREFELAVVFTIKELADLAGMDTRRMGRLLESGGLKLIKSGRRWAVCRIELRDELPAIYEALLQRVHAQETTRAASSRLSPAPALA